MCKDKDITIGRGSVSLWGQVLPEGRVRRPIKASAIIALGPVPAIPVLSLSLSLCSFGYVRSRLSDRINILAGSVIPLHAWMSQRRPLCNDLPPIRSRCVHVFCIPSADRADSARSFPDYPVLFYGRSHRNGFYSNNVPPVLEDFSEFSLRSRDFPFPVSKERWLGNLSARLYVICTNKLSERVIFRFYSRAGEWLFIIARFSSND